MRQMYYPDGASADSVGGEESPQSKFEIPAPWEWPQRIETRMVDRKTGTLASTWCASEDAYLEFFLPGTAPTELCRPESGLFGGPLRSRLRRDTMSIDTLMPRRRRRDF
jgi:hypothetical protein